MKKEPGFASFGRRLNLDKAIAAMQAFVTDCVVPKRHGSTRDCRSIRATSIMSIGVLVSGCCGGPQTKEDTIGPLKAITTQADVRSFYVKADKTLPDFGRFVAEPPPDVFANLTESLSLLAKASETKGLGAVELQMLSKITKEAARLGVRSQGVLYLRDAGYRLAEGYMNGAFLPAGPGAVAPAPGADTSKTNQAPIPASADAATAVVAMLHGPNAAQDPATKSMIQGLAVALAQDPHLARSLLEASNYRSAYAQILNNARDIILRELELNPTLSTLSEDDVEGEQPRPRLAADFVTANGKTTLTVTFANKELAGIDVNIAVSPKDSTGKDLQAAELTVRPDDGGRGKATWELPGATTTVTLTAPTSTPLTKQVPPGS